jgi:hypothetical protein
MDKQARGSRTWGRTQVDAMTIPRLRYNRFRDEGGFSPPHDSRHHAEDLHDFHLPMAALHHAAASGGGVLRGLAVHGRLGGAELTVEEGVALDSAGRLIVLSGDGRADIGAAPDTGEHDEQPVPVRMPVPSEPGRYYLTVQFNLLLRANEGAIGRQEQAPWLRFRPVDGFADDVSVVLAVSSWRPATPGPPHWPRWTPGGPTWPLTAGRPARPVGAENRFIASDQHVRGHPPSAPPATAKPA